MKHRPPLAALATLSLALLALPAMRPAAAATASVASASAVQAASAQLQALAADYYDANARFEPLMATENGDGRYDDQLGLSIAPDRRAAQFQRYRSLTRRLQQIARAQLDPADQTSYDILRYELHGLLALAPYPEHLLPLSHMDSVPVILANYASGNGSQPLSTVAQYEAYLHRLQQLPAWTDQAIANMRSGLRQHITQPQAIMQAALPQLQQLLSDTPESNIYYSPITRLPDSFSAADRQRLTAAYRATVSEQLLPALRRLASFVEHDYLPHCRHSSGLGALPQGHAWYQARVANATTTNLSPAQIHAIGLREVARIQQQFAVLGPKLGYTGPAAGLPLWVAAQPQFHPFKTEDEVQAVYQRLNGVLDSKLPQMFTLLPKARLDLRLEPELSRATASDHYTPPAGDGSRPGVFWSVVNDPGKYISTGMTTLFLHEGKPGHHFHIALMQELPLPDFRKYGGNNAYTEGWALYAETLGKEMGLFDDTAQYYGHLNDELLRAVRLVVDTGLHDQGWPRERSIAYMRATLGYDDVARSETERYMAWPGQALGYKIGALKIMALRQRAERALGDKFSLPAFHAVVLGEGTLPLALLEAKVERWIASQR